MEVLAQKIKDTWVSRVRALLGSDTYKVSKKWDKTFEKAAVTIRDNPNVVLIEFVDAQIHYVISKNEPLKLWPTLLLGKAMDRYFNHKIKAATGVSLIEFYQNQAQIFTRLMDTIGFDQALGYDAAGFSPLWLAFMRFSAGVEISNDLIAGARAEIEVHTKAKIEKIFSPEFLGSIA